MVGPVDRGARPEQRGSPASAPDPDLQGSQNAHALVREIGGGATLVTAAGPARRLGTLTATKLIRDLAETENLAALYRQAGQLTSDGTFRGKLEGLSAEEERSSWTIRGILARMDSYVTDSPQAARRGLELPSPHNGTPAGANRGWVQARAPIL